MHYLAEHQTFSSTQALNAAVYEHIKRNAYDLTDTARAALKQIARYAVKFGGAAHLKAETLADLIGKSIKTARRVLNQLAALNIVKKVATTRKINGGKGANIIVILPLAVNDQSTVTTRQEPQNADVPTVKTSKTENEPSDSINLKNQKHVKDTAAVPAEALKNSLPTEIYNAMSRYFDAADIYKYYGLLLRAKASVDPSLMIEQDPEPFVDAWHKTILKAKLNEISRFDDYVYASFRQAAWTVKARENRVKNVGLLAEFESFLQAE
ncbi:helix-turn-helix domain-containing protein [Bacillus stratosphericus]|uniref:helix-turn-helix domain-containing protein n=1 Tax=Bacillus stratosphericus TaxID=293386 RepID=UPI001CF93C37|nr:helix-turn-helix domain-containing protein [Bacillus stratosphericus]